VWCHSEVCCHAPLYIHYKLYKSNPDLLVVAFILLCVSFCVVAVTLSVQCYFAASTPAVILKLQLVRCKRGRISI